jgi:hypothetical protein
LEESPQSEFAAPNYGTAANLSATFEVDLSKGSHVPVTLQDGQLTHSVRSKIGFM